MLGGFMTSITGNSSGFKLSLQPTEPGAIKDNDVRVIRLPKFTSTADDHPGLQSSYVHSCNEAVAWIFNEEDQPELSRY